MTLFSLIEEMMLSHPRMILTAMSNRMLVPSTSRTPQTSYKEPHSLTQAIQIMEEVRFTSRNQGTIASTTTLLLRLRLFIPSMSQSLRSFPQESSERPSYLIFSYMALPLLPSPSDKLSPAVLPRSLNLGSPSRSG